MSGFNYAPANLDDVKAAWRWFTALNNTEHEHKAADAGLEAWLTGHDAETRSAALKEAAQFVDSQRYIDEPPDLRQVRDRLYGIADGTYDPTGEG